MLLVRRLPTLRQYSSLPAASSPIYKALAAEPSIRAKPRSKKKTNALRYSQQSNVKSVNMSTIIKPMGYFDGPLVWIDCEMTGLDPSKDKIIEIAVLITNGNLDVVDEGIQFVIKTSKPLLDGMDEWCTKQHGSTGLTKSALESKHTTEHACKEVLAYIKRHIPKQRAGVLAGSSVHADRSFLVREMPDIVDWLHYRIVDVSSIKELCRRWYPHRGIPRLGESNHRALDDIRGSINELQWYRKNIFIASEGPAQGEGPPKALLQEAPLEAKSAPSSPDAQ